MTRFAEPHPLVVDLGDWPGGQLLAFTCQYPESQDGGIDLILPAHCAWHNRNWYWCPNAGVVWCDGGAPDYEHHTARLLYPLQHG